MVHRRSTDIGPDVTEVRAARRFVAAALDEWGIAARDDVAVVTSEIITNALVHAEGHINLAVVNNTDVLRLEVSDGSSIVPIIRELDHQATEGRGMRLVERLVDRWGADLSDAGKTVWVEFSL